MSLTYKKNCDGVLPHFLYFLIWDFCTRPAFNGLWKHIQMLTKCTKFMTQSLNCIFLYTVCFGILIVSLNTTFYLFFHVYTEISQNVWSWKFGLKSWKSIGQNVYEPCLHGPLPSLLCFGPVCIYLTSVVIPSSRFFSCLLLLCYLLN